MVRSILKNKIVFITGGTSGIGFSLVKAFSQLECKVITCGRSSIDDLYLKKPDSHKFFSENNIEYFQCDISNNLHVLDISNKILNKFSKIDILINNSGIGIFSSFLNVSVEEFDLMMNTNFKGPFLIIKSFLPKMIENKSGLIINISSVATYELFENCSIYNASKAAFLALSKTLRKEVRKDGIKVLDILPGATASNIWSEEMLESHGNKMLSTDDLSEVITNAAFLSFNNNIMLEEIEIRPQNGNI